MEYSSEDQFCTCLAVQMLLYYIWALKNLNGYFNQLDLPECDISDLNSVNEYLEGKCFPSACFPTKFYFGKAGAFLLQLVKKLVSENSDFTATNIDSICNRSEELLVEEYWLDPSYNALRDPVVLLGFRKAMEKFSSKEKLEEMMVGHLKVNRDWFNLVFDIISQDKFEPHKACSRLGVLPYGLGNFVGVKKFWHNRKLLIHNSGSLRYSDNFKEIKVIGRGGFGTVMKVTERNESNPGQDFPSPIHKSYAIKIVLLPKDAEEKVKKEVDLLRDFKDTANIVNFIDSWTEEFSVIEITQFINSLGEKGKQQCCKILPYKRKNDVEKGNELVEVLFIQMELCNENLEAYLEWRKGISFNTSLKYAHEIVKGLKNLHEKKVYHKDLKAPNIFIGHEKGETSVKIGDLGASRLTKTSSASYYQKKEQIDDEMLKKYSNDLFSFAFVLLQLFYPMKIGSDQFLEHSGNLYLYKKLLTNFHETIADEGSKAIGKLILNLINFEKLPNISEVEEILKKLTLSYELQKIFEAYIPLSLSLNHSKVDPISKIWMQIIFKVSRPLLLMGIKFRDIKLEEHRRLNFDITRPIHDHLFNSEFNSIEKKDGCTFLFNKKVGLEAGQNYVLTLYEDSGLNTFEANRFEGKFKQYEIEIGEGKIQFIFDKIIYDTLLDLVFLIAL